jgi:hypothetical protein
MHNKIRAFFNIVPERFGALHFAGMGYGTFFPELVENSEAPVVPPYDFMDLRRHGLIIGYTPTGCLDGATGGLCSHCVWELRPDVCKDERSAAWAERLERLCDWIGIEGDWPAGPRVGDKYFHEPLITALDTEIWRPDLEIPEDLLIAREPDTILIYHAVGNYATRRANDRDIKGTGAVFSAVEKLKSEGLKVQLVFVTDMPSDRVRFIQVQADIIVDQLNYGRYGANAREGFMLGKPVVVRLDPAQPNPLPPLRSVTEAPVANADEHTLTDVLRHLANDAALRQNIGTRARFFAVAWHGSDACAERYEELIERLRAGLPPRCARLLPTSAGSAYTERG